MSRTIKHQIIRNKVKMPKEERETKTATRTKILKELEDDYEYNLDYTEI